MVEKELLNNKVSTCAIVMYDYKTNFNAFATSIFIFAIVQKTNELWKPH
jgi:hypothetical protein